MPGRVYDQGGQLCLAKLQCGMDAVHILQFNVQINQVETYPFFRDSLDQGGTVKEGVAIDVYPLL